MRPPFLIFLGDVPFPVWAKTGMGIAHWRREDCVGQLRLPGCTADLGLPDMTVEEARAAGAATMVVGIANDGGFIPASWAPSLIAALEAGLDLAAGLHERLADVPAVRDAAARLGRRLHDVRIPTDTFKTGTGKPRSGRRMLTVGTDCGVGKKFTTLCMWKEMRARGMDADFCATGQTGIMIAGRGVAVDSVVADFIAGAAEWLSPDAAPAHWHLIEGQGSLFHPAYAGVTLGLIHGSQPDALVLCHDVSRRTLYGFPDFPIPVLEEAIETYERAARLTNKRARVVGIALNTVSLDEVTARDLTARTGDSLKLPCCDPVREGAAALVNALQSPDLA